MKKIPTLFQRDFTGPGKPNLTGVVTPGCEWVLGGTHPATRKYDGTCVLLTYELIGPKVNGNPERATEHRLIRHVDAEVRRSRRSRSTSRPTAVRVSRASSGTTRMAGWRSSRERTSDEH